MPIYTIISSGMPIEATEAFMMETFPGNYTQLITDPWQWLIDTGPFYDRFGAVKMSVLTSQDPSIKAIIQDLSIRKWVDLTRSDVAESINYISGIIPGVTPELISSILTDPVMPDEQLALRKTYFS
jgi:hypothetical protein